MTEYCLGFLIKQTIPIGNGIAKTQYKCDKYMNRLYQSLQMDRLPFNESGEYIPRNSEKERIQAAFHWYNEKTKSLIQYI